MKTWAGSLLILTLVGCATDPRRPASKDDIPDCEGSQQEVEQLRRELDATSATGEPDVLSGPTVARQNRMMQAMRSAAAQQKLRQRLASELKFQNDHCQ
ncbi:MAG: hypothetical protein P1U54_09490 [Immundisolibacteraceae bacterium]|nr:hypothetical protein [Immundisolibacteraceae bacterium]